jgi:hypothetical protein
MDSAKIVKIALSILTIAISVGPLRGVVYIYRDNLVGLVLPPNTPGMSSLTNSNINLSNLTSIVSNLNSLASLNPIQPIGNPTFNETTGAFDYPFNFTNPLPQKISIDQLSADIISNNGTKVGNISIENPINVNPGESAVVNITGGIDPQFLNQYKDQISQGVSIDNLNVTIGGITLHVGDLSQFGSFQLPG